MATASSGDTSLTFTYDGNGIRTSKTVNGVEHKYYYSGGKLLRETYGSNILDFAYNSDGSLYSLRHKHGNTVTYYYYVTNLQGDVIGLVDADGTAVASYEYDPYGDIVAKSGTLADLNPMRYRGYYYDAETTLYYLQSRYYDPAIGRFINADSLVSTDQGILGNNMFAYCLNNPVNRFDTDGKWSLPNWAKVAIGTVATVAAVAVTVVTGYAVLPVLLSVATSTAVSGAIGYATGGVAGMKNGLANGFMMGGLSAFGGSMISAGIKAVKTARQGITIGRNMSKGFANVQNAAGLTDTATYSSDALWRPLRDDYYNGIKACFGEAAANRASCICNRIYIKTMRALGAVIYDSGLNGAADAGMFYGMELKELADYVNLVKIY